MPEENRKIELDLDQDQPVEAKKVEGAWGLYEELAKAKAENGTTPPVADFGIAREADTNGVNVSMGVSISSMEMVSNFQETNGSGWTVEAINCRFSWGSGCISR